MLIDNSHAYPCEWKPFCDAAFCQELTFEAWEHMTFGGIQLTDYSRRLLAWLNDIRFEAYGHNYWRVDAAC